MGMFDTIVDYELVCPYCNSPFYVNLQTKNLTNLLENYTVGKKYSNQYIENESFKSVIGDSLTVQIAYIGSCNSPICSVMSKMKNYLIHKDTLNGMRFFNGEYLVTFSKTDFVIDKVLSILPTEEYEKLSVLKRKFVYNLKKSKYHYDKFSKLSRKLGGTGLELTLQYFSI